MAIDTSAFRQQGRLTGRGPAPAGNRAAPRKGVGVVRSVFRHHQGERPSSRAMESQPGERPALVRSEMVPATAWGSRPRLSANLTQRGALAARVAHNHQVVRSIRTAATNRVTPSLVTERVCKTCACAHAGFDSPATHHATVAQRQSFTLPT